ncbi:sialidase family protein [Salipaludibacillus agaradhaerens]|jgi:predicted neuraminidase|uniref:sialidase family protein n=1 Tax=Salipaludibacillus agaradhaerens TaxID=76935 RepID=UPI0009978D7F|nr:sialidase family protein [Salipaludibacillus agaradhaerens]
MLGTFIDEQYKIPILYPHNHASNLLELDSGDLLCTWFGGSKEGKADITVMVSTFSKENRTWHPPQAVSDDSTRSEQNPILFKNPNGQIWLIYTAQYAVHQDSSVVRYSVSDDEGVTWSKVKDLFDKPGTFVRNPPVITENNDIILPAYYCLKSTNGFLGNDYSVVKRSKDNGNTWEETKIEGSEGLVHLSLVHLEGQRLVGFFRSRKADKIYRTVSNDLGFTWSKPSPTHLPNNNASIQATKLSRGQLVMVFNNINAEERPPKENRPPWFDPSDMDKVGVNKENQSDAIWGVVRNPLSIAVSEDEGLTWKHVKSVIESQDINSEPEFSYPSIKQDREGKIHITFTYLRQYIQHVIVDEQVLYR